MPPFTFSNHPDTVNNIFPMTPGNSAPALIVWLFMVTHKNFLKALEASADDLTQLQFVDSNHSAVGITGISKMTNLAPAAVMQIFEDSYLMPTANDDVRTAQQDAFRSVANQFQAFASTHVVNWDEDDCPGVIGITHLATSGASVDPNS